jgi:hypothetical protein
LPVDLTDAVDRWGENLEISRPEAIRRLVELGLKANENDSFAAKVPVNYGAPFKLGII